MTKLEKELYVATTLAMLWVLTQTHQASAEVLGMPKSVVPTDLRLPPHLEPLPPVIALPNPSLPNPSPPNPVPLPVSNTPPPVFESVPETERRPASENAAAPEGFQLDSSIVVRVENPSVVVNEVKEVKEVKEEKQLVVESEIVLAGSGQNDSSAPSVASDLAEQLAKESQPNPEIGFEKGINPPVTSLTVPPLSSKPARNINSATNKQDFLVGIDVSDYQENVDWRRVADSGVSFAYLKATEGKSYRAETFDGYRKSARQNGVITGGYHFFRPEVSAQLQAENFLTKIGKLEVDDLPPALDLEDPALWTGFSRSEKLKMVLTWLDIVEAKTGVKPVIYSSPTFMEDVLDSPPELTKYDLWLAHYTSLKEPSLPKRFNKWKIWQHSDRGSLPGIDGDVDLNRFAGDRNQLLALGRTNGDGIAPEHSSVANLPHLADSTRGEVNSTEPNLAAVKPSVQTGAPQPKADAVIPKPSNSDDGVLSFDVASL